MSEPIHKNFLHRWLDGFFIAVHNSIHPSHAEWGAYANDVAAHRSQIIGTLVYTEGGSPSAFQRKQLRDAYADANDSPPVSILTNSAVARMAITAFNLFFDNKMKAFAPRELDEALDYLKISKEKRPLLKGALEEMKRELGIRAQTSSWF